MRQYRRLKSSVTLETLPFPTILLYNPFLANSALYGPTTPVNYYARTVPSYSNYRNFCYYVYGTDTKNGHGFIITDNLTTASNYNIVSFDSHMILDDSDDNYEYWESITEPVSTYRISGKRKFNTVVNPLPTWEYFPEIVSKNTVWFTTGVFYPCNGEFAILSANNNNYVGAYSALSFRHSILSSGGKISYSYIHLYGTSIERNIFYNELNDAVIDFGDGFEMPAVMYDWIIENSEPIYDFNITIKSNTGDIVNHYDEKIVEVILSYAGNTATLTTIGTTNDIISAVEWTPQQIDGMRFIGLSINTGAMFPNITIGNTKTEIIADVEFYEVYAYYDEVIEPTGILLYQNTAEPNRVDKTDYLTDVLQLQGVLRDECSLIAPSIIFESPAYLQFNYVHIPAFGRYYFVLGIDSVSKNLWRMRLNCDVLMSYKEKIWLLDAVIDRQENDFNPLLNDPNVPAQTDRNVDVIEMNSLDGIGGGTFDVQDVPDFSRRCDYVLLTVGEGVNAE